MARVTGQFFHLHQDSQEYGSDDQHMVSRVFFSMAVDGRPVLDADKGPRKLYADVKLPVGGDYLASVLEVGRPAGYRGPWNHEAFAAAATTYVHTCVGPGARGISFAGAATVRMRDNHFAMLVPFEFEVPETAGGTW
jgi:hypothetical protein